MNPSKPNSPIPGKPAATPAKPGTPTPGAAPSSARPGTMPPAASRPGVAPTSASPRPTAVPAARSPAGKPDAARPTGKVVHDKRGNAVWDFLAQTGRMAIESTTRLLKRLETPELKVEQSHEEELRIAPDSTSFDQGGGYDPYNQATKPRRK